MIIGLSGYARSGKDTVANILVEDYAFERIAFADPIRELLLQINPFVIDNTRIYDYVEENGWELAKAHPEVRRLLQSLGVSMREVVDSEIWIETALRKMEYGKNYVISDVRFLNEANMIDQFEGQLWRVERPEVIATNSHISESALDNHGFSQIIVNDGSIEDLKEKITSFTLAAQN